MHDCNSYSTINMKRHFTATAFIVDDIKGTLLLWHKHLNRWMPPGGHVDEDELPEETARRECKEETGLDVEIIGDAQSDLFADPAEGRMMKKPLAMLLEEIPARPDRGEEAHQHMDFLFIARLIDPMQKPEHLEAEAHDKMRWFTKEDVEKLDEKTEIFGNVKRYILGLL